MRIFKGCVCLFLGAGIFFSSTENASAHMRLFIRPWWPVPVIVAPILPPVVLAPAPQDPRPYFGSVDTDVSPRDAQVIVDGEYRGIADGFDGAPAYLELAPGKHKVEFKKEGFESASLIVAVEPRELVSIDLALKEIPAAAGPVEGKTYEFNKEGTGYVELDVTPADAVVYIDDAFYGTVSQFRETGNKIMLRAGNHTIEIGRPGYTLYRGSITIPENGTVKLGVSLQK
jgi:hypothetical protein